MTIILVLAAVGSSYLIGRVQGYEKAEQHDREAKSFWKEVKERGL